MIICQKAGARFLKMDENHDQKKEQLQFNLYCIDIPPLKATDGAEKGLQLCQQIERLKVRICGILLLHHLLILFTLFQLNCFL